jgi:hypothetical protein
MQLNIQELGAGEQIKITYDDILAKMNMQIVGGRLQYIAPSKSQNETNEPSKTNKTNKTNQIYNKYFSKETVEDTPLKPPLIFKSRAEYERYLVIKRAQDRAVKGRSTKLFFYSQPDYPRWVGNNNQLFGLIKK